jgi:hypothetical protein
MIGMVVNVFVAVRYVMRGMTGIYAKENAINAVKLAMWNMIGTAVSARSAVKNATNSTTGTAANAINVGKGAMKVTIGISVKAYVNVVVKLVMYSTTGTGVFANVAVLIDMNGMAVSV